MIGEILFELLFVLSFIPFMGLIITIIFEWIVYSIFIRKNYLKLLGYSILINGLTNPLANLIISNSKLPIYFLIIELLVFIGEIFLIKYLLKTKYWKAILISFIANLITAFTGILVF